MAQLKQLAPEVYDLWLRTTEATHRHQLDMEMREQRDSGKTVSRAQHYGLAAVLGGFGLAGYALYRDAEGVAALIGVLDLVGLATVFLSSRFGASKPDQEPYRSDDEDDDMPAP